VLWKEFCQARAPKMMNDLHSDGSHIVDGLESPREASYLLLRVP